MDWQSLWRDFQEQPLFTPVFNLFYQFMEIKRGDRFPFYIYPQAKKWISFEDTFITFLDYMVDAHELERNTADKNRSFYQRSLYVMENYLRYQNETMANLMFDTQLRRLDYDRLNSLMNRKLYQYYAMSTAVHVVGFSSMAFFFRFRRVGAVPTLLVASAYYYAFQKTNNILYKVVVDRNVMSLARQMGQHSHVQPVGHFKNRGVNFKGQ